MAEPRTTPAPELISDRGPSIDPTDAVYDTWREGYIGGQICEDKDDAEYGDDS